MSALRAIHAERRKIGLEADDEAWRDLLERTTGQRSAKGLSPKQSKAVLDELSRLAGNKEPSKPVRRRLEGPYAKKLQALWIACWNLGLIDNADDAALNAFAVRQSSVSHANWIKHHEDAVSVIEALKKMTEREGVKWAPIGPLSPEYTNLPGYRIATAQFLKVAEEGRYQKMSFARFIHTVTGKHPHEADARDWIAVMNNLGIRIREKKKEAQS